MTLEGVATVLRVLQEKLSVMPEGAASALKQIHSQVHLTIAVGGCCLPDASSHGPVAQQ